jgi:DNA-binding CsgD family transcriptional regulator
MDQLKEIFEKLKIAGIPEARFLAKDLLEKAVAAGDESYEMRAHYQLGYRCYDDNRELSDFHLERSFELSKKLGNTRMQANIWSAIGIKANSDGRSKDARDAFEKAIALAETGGHLAALAFAQASLARWFQLHGLHCDALNWIEKAIQSSKGTPNEAFATYSYAVCLDNAGNSDAALSTAELALELCRNRGPIIDLNFALDFIARHHARRNQREIAQRYFEEAISVAGRVENRVHSLCGLAELYLEEGDVASCERLLAEAEQVSNNASMQSIFMTRAQLQLVLKSPTQAIKNLSLAEEHFPEQQHGFEEHLFNLYVDAYRQLGDWERVAHYLEQASAYRKMINSAEFLSRANAVQISLAIEGEKYQRELQKVRADNLQQQLGLQASAMAAQAELLDKFRSQVVQVFQEMGEPLTALKKIKEKLHQLPQQEIDFQKFEADFTQAHPEFRTKLTQKYPELSDTEIRVCMMLKLGLKSVDTARLMNISERGVEQHRLRIRRKFGLTGKENLIEVLQLV